VVDSPHPDSLITTPDGRTVYLKVHRCLWSGEYPENSLLAIQECYRERVARVEIDINILRDADFLVTHDPDLDRMTTGTGLVAETTRSEATRLRFRHAGAVSSERPSLLSDVVDAIRAEPFPTMMELDAPDFRPWPWPRVEGLARLVEPVKDRIVFGSCADWNLRRLLRVDPTVPVGFNPAYYLDWIPPEGPPEPSPRGRGAYGYLDDHPLALERFDTTANYLRDRLGGLVRLVPGSRELHIRLQTFERMRDDGVDDAVDLFHQAGMLVDVWTLNAGTPRWQERLHRAIAAGVDMVTTDTAHELAAFSRPPHRPTSPTDP
jgi:glycerophosphoryl diester phosphodiesterase